MTAHAHRFDRRTLLAAALAAGGSGVVAAMPGGDRGSGDLCENGRLDGAGGLGPRGDRARDLLHAGEPLLRPLLRHLPRGAGLRRPPARQARQLRPGLARWSATPTLLPFHLDTASGMASAPTTSTTAGRPSTSAGTTAPTAPSSGRTSSPQYQGPEQGVLTMGYYRRRTSPSITRWPTPSPSATTTTARCWGRRTPTASWRCRARSIPRARPAGRWSSRTSHSDAVCSVHWDTMPEVLEDAGVSWKVYNPPGTIYTPATIQKHGILSDAILPYFSQYKNPTSALYQKAFLPQYPSDFVSDIARGTLPAVSWIIPPARLRRAPVVAAGARRVVHQPGALGAGGQPRGVVQDGALPHVRRERRLLRPRAAAGGAAGHRRANTSGRRRCRTTPTAGRPDRHGLPGADARPLAFQPRAATWPPRCSTTPRSCGSWRSASACRRPTSRPGAARPRAT